MYGPLFFCFFDFFVSLFCFFVSSDVTCLLGYLLDILFVCLFVYSLVCLLGYLFAYLLLTSPHLLPYRNSRADLQQPPQVSTPRK